MTAIFVPTSYGSMIQPAAKARNGQIADALHETRLRIDTNQLMAYRTKEWFRSPGYTAPPNGASGTRDRWYFYGHSGPYAKRLRVRVVMAKDNNFDGHTISDCYAKVSIYTSGGVLVGSALEFHHGSSGTPASDVPDEWGAFDSTVDISADTDYYGIIQEVDYARIISCMVNEESLPPDTTNGYFETLAANQNIYDNQRGDMVTALHSVWKRGGATAIKWTVNSSTRSTVSATPTNVVDNTSTAVSAASPGWTLDFTGKHWRSDTTVPCVLYVYGRYTAGAAGRHGDIVLKNSSGTTIASISGGWNPGATPAWVFTTVNMPTGSDKYDILYSTTSGTFDIYAACLFEYA